MSDLVEIIKTVGLPVALVVWFMWQANQREKSQGERDMAEAKTKAERDYSQDERFTSLESFCRTELLDCTKESTKVNMECAKSIQENTKCMQTSNDIMSKTIIALGDR
jgi:hypothetical protein